MKVQNLNRTTGRKSKCCNSWIGHWEKITGESAGKCRARNCSNSAEVGAHVVRSLDNTWRIVPFCYECNKKEGWIELNKGTITVDADHYSC